MAGELRKHGLKIKLHDQPFKVLTLLLEHPGEVVTREQICQHLWPADTFVDSETGLNSAVMRLRDALGDSADHPRFVETLPRRGYRFLAAVETVDSVGREIQKSISNAPPADPRGSHSDTKGTSIEVLRPEMGRTAGARRPLWIATLTVLLGIFATATWLVIRHLGKPYTIAVLPLKNLNSEPGSDYFSDGLTDDIINRLSVIDGLQVKSRTSSFLFKEKPLDVQTIGEQLGASFIVEGSALRSGDRLRVNVRLIRVADDVSLWSGQYDRDLQDVFAVQNEISRSIVNELRLKLGQGQRRYETNLAAYDQYLKARSLANGLPGIDYAQIAESIPFYEAAIAKDADFAPAYAGMANAYAYLSGTSRTMPASQAYQRIKQPCEKAVDLDPLLAEAHACMGMLYSRERNWSQAEKAFRHALGLNPNLSRSRLDYALWVLQPLGKLDEAQKQARSAWQLDPLSMSPVNALDFILMTAGKYQEVLDNSRSILQRDPGNFYAQQLRGRALVQQGRLDEGIAQLDSLQYSEAYQGYAYAKAGRRENAEKLAADNPQFPWIQAFVYAGLGDKDGAIDGLRKMAALDDPRTGSYSLSPEVAILRGDHRLNELRASLSLPPFP